MIEKQLIYLASPYSNPNARVRELRFRSACIAASILMHDGLYVFSPIAHTHSIAVLGSLPTGWEYWAGYDRCILSECYLMIVLMLDGWEDSAGIKGEIEICREMNIPIRYARPDDILPLARQIASLRKPADPVPIGLIP